MAPSGDEGLRGVWAALVTPFDAHDRFDEGAFRENLRRLVAAGVHGAYTTDGDGEFYAIELDEFRALVDVFADEAGRVGLPTQVGVTWLHTRGVVDRLRHCAARGIGGAHVGHPFFMEMTPQSLRQFWRDVSAAVPEEFGLIHYNAARLPHPLVAADYAALAAEVPQLAGSKQSGRTTPADFEALVRETPRLSHLTVDHRPVACLRAGARGVYSWLVNVSPRFALELYGDCVAGRWESAARRQEQLDRLIRIRGECFPGHSAGVVSKALIAASGFLTGGPGTRRPYLPIPAREIARFRDRVREELPTLFPPCP